ncbi:hypothetical protein JX265_006809 [Neoarthrinium moseri]|uniref:Uncharacterized protein n=1 Tax=Neoarthrinium moseri TaxID=1658444 RepID=A0A9P9WKX7_9PEZI|nr:hypothetical protein JX265_006809 [Neoarthrinium moseri]
MDVHSRDLEPIHMYINTLANGELHSHSTPITEFLKTEVSVPSYGNLQVTWLHVPVNDMGWVETLMKKWYPKSDGLDERFWSFKLRPAPSQIKTKPYHSQHMDPSCALNSGDLSPTRIVPSEDQSLVQQAAVESSQGLVESIREQPLLHLYLPYMAWQYYGDFEKGCALRLSGASETLDRQNTGSDEDSNARNDARVHPRRSLDQFYYSSLADTSKRDADQTISKWTGSDIPEDGRNEAAADSLMIVVDQIWCWVLDNLLSFFPSPTQDAKGASVRFIGLYESICQQCTSCKTVWDLYSCLVKEATTFLFHQVNRNFTDLLEVYSWVVNKKVASQTEYFQMFHEYNSTGQLESAFLDGSQELRLVLDVADIIDELKMIQHIVHKQREVIKSLVVALRTPSDAKDDSNETIVHTVLTISGNEAGGSAKQTNLIIFNPQTGLTLSETIRFLAQGISGNARSILIHADEELNLLLIGLDTVKRDASTAHKELLNLLDLKQKAAALAEARATSQQGRVILLFTIVTIVFLPLSFFTSYFGQNVSDITGDENNPTTWDLWRYGTIAYYIAGPDTHRWNRQAYRNRRGCV